MMKKLLQFLTKLFFYKSVIAIISEYAMNRKIQKQTESVIQI